MQIYEVGGSCRNRLLGLRVSDLDFAVEADSYEDMKAFILSEGCEIYQEREDCCSIRAKLPKGFGGIEEAGKCAGDFTLARLEGFYTDGRHPDEVSPCDIITDLGRRDFCMNSIAVHINTREILDPYGGIHDIRNKVIRPVGKVEDRMKEDPLRLIRAIRFSCQLGFEFSEDLKVYLKSKESLVQIKRVNMERVREELTKAFKLDTVKCLNILQCQSINGLVEYLFNDVGLWLLPTTKAK